MLDFDLSFPPGRRSLTRVRVGRGALERLVRELVREPPGSPLVVVTDSHVRSLWAEPLARALARRGLAVDLLSFPAGERSKTRATKGRLEDRLAALGAGRDAAIVAVGGGVVGDLAGFLAATWQRGIPVVQVPTSLLAMADAALGGKTAVNLPLGKNLVGAFHQPWGVYADVAALATLPERHYLAGFAEVVKSAAIADRAFFRWLEDALPALRARNPRALEHAVARCLRIKGRLVRRDEREAGPRAALNFGHTAAHALEAASRWRIDHGRAVAIGMCLEARLAVRKRGFPAADARRLAELLARFGLPTSVPRRLSAATIVAAARRDKKTRAGRTHYALPLGLGRMPSGESVTLALSDAELGRVLDELT